MIKEPAFEGKRYTGFHDCYGVPICEGDLVITRERKQFYRWVAVRMGRYRWWNNCWWGHFGRWTGKVWLGVVVEMDNGINQKQWIFQSVNASATIHAYWQEDLQVVQIPSGCTYTWRYADWRERQ